MSLTVIRPFRNPSPSTTGKLLDPVAAQHLARLVERRSDGNGHEPLARHQVRDRLLEVALEAQVAIRQDPHEPTGLVRDRDAGDVVCPHQLERVGHPIPRAERHGLDDHARLRALDLIDLRDLILDRQVAVDDPDAAFARERNRHARLGHRVHRGGADRDRKLDLAGEARAGRDLVRKHRRLGRNEQDVVERQTFLGESLTQREEPLDLLTTELDAHARPWPATASARQSRAPPGDDAERLTRTPRKHETQAPRGDLGSTVPALASALNV